MKVEVCSEYSRISRWLEQLCQKLFQSEGPAVICAPRKSAYRPGAQSVYRLHGSEIGDILIGFDREKTRFERSALLIRLAAGISNSQDLRGRFFVSPERATPSESFKEHCVMVRQGDESLSFSFFINPDHAPSLAHQEPMLSWRRPISQSFKLALLLSAPFSRESLAQSSTLSVEGGRFGLFDEQERFFLVNSMHEWRGGMTLEQDTAAIGQFPVKIELGTITVSAEGLLDLRPGDRIMLPHIGPLFGTLRVGSEPWARVKVEEGGSQIVLHVEELLGIEETFRAEPRLLK